MTTHTVDSTTHPVNSTKTLLPFAAALVAGMIIVQIVIALTSGNPGLLGGLLTAVIALGGFFWQWRNIKKITKIRFGKAIIHALTFVVITTSFNLHALIHFTIASGSADPASLATEFFSTSWFGATLCMSALWGVGLAASLIGAIAQRGWED